MVKGGHLGTRLVVVEKATAGVRVATGLVVEAAKRISTGRSYALSSTLKIEEGNEEEVTALCKSIVQWAQEKQVLEPPHATRIVSSLLFYSECAMS